MWTEHVQSIMEVQGIESRMFDEPPYSPSNDDKTKYSYVTEKR